MEPELTEAQKEFRASFGFREPTEARPRKLIDFPDAWKEVCRQIVEAYRADPANAVRGKELGFTALRDRMMEGEDTFDRGRRVRDPALTRQDLQHWVLYAKKPTDPKFWYIDRFVRSIQLTDWYYEISKIIIENRESEHKRALADLYQLQNTGKAQRLSDACRAVSGRLFVTDYIDDAYNGISLPTGDSFRQIGVFIRPSTGAAFTIIVVYAIDPISEICRDPTNGRFLAVFGYAIPAYDYVGSAIYCIAKTFNKDEFYNPQNAFPMFATSALVIDLGRDRLYIDPTSSIDDPCGLSTRTIWKATEGKKSLFASTDIKNFSDDATELKYIGEESYEFEEFLGNLTNGYLLW